MSEVEQENQSLSGVPLAVEWHVPETMHNQYLHNVVVQPGQNEITLMLFETHIPPYIGSPEANREYLQQQKARFECVGKFVIAPQLVPEIIKALQVGLDNYNALKASEEREVR
jgi:flagellin-specific chaperone FliS